MYIFIYTILIIIALLVGVLFTIYAFQEKLIFYPEKLGPDYKFDFHIKFEEHFIKINEEATLNAVLFKAEKESKGLIYYQHGNAGNIQIWGRTAEHYTSRGWDVLMYDFRGYGKSNSEIKKERMLFGDAEKVYEWALQFYAASAIIFWGRSLGTGIAAKLATLYDTKFLMLETPYYSFYEAAKFHYPYLPTSLLLNYHFRTFKYLKKIKVEVYIIHGTADETVPYESGLKLKKDFPDINFYTIEGAGHIDFDAFDIYQNYLDEILGKPQ